MRQSAQAEYEQYTIDQGREMEALHQQHKAESSALKARLQDLEGSFADAARDEEASSQQREKTRARLCTFRFSREAVDHVLCGFCNHKLKLRS